MNKGKEKYWLNVKVLKLTPKAVLVTEEVLDKDNKQITHWLPLSQVSGDFEEDKYCDIEVPMWLIEKTGLTV